MDKVKEAFQKIKQDIEFLKQEIYLLNSNLVEIQRELGEISRKVASTRQTPIQTPSTHPSTHNLPREASKPQNMPISTGNGGVPTDRQTDRQTDKTPIKIQDAGEILNSLDTIKKEIRLKFKRITEQELLVFSTIYQIEEEQGHCDYRVVSEKLGLSESSIRDYVGRLIRKGIPVDKKRLNNKNIQLSISSDLKKIASLHTILRLRDI